MPEYNATDDRPLELNRASVADLGALETLVSAYHAFEGIEMSAERRRLALSRLLEDEALGEIWLISLEEALVGYIAICFGYSIEFAGRDAFLDEFYLLDEARGRGIGGRVIDRVALHLAEAGIAALHLEVDNDNAGAQRFYDRQGFFARKKYHLMTLSLQPR